MREYHWWLITRDEEGRPYVVYACPDRGSTGGEDVARSRGFDILGSMEFTVKRFPTRDIGKVRSYVCGNRLEGGAGLRESTRRQGHDRSLRRMLNRRGIR